MDSSEVWNLCSKPNDQMLMLKCVHDPCINCAATTYAEQIHIKGQSNQVIFGRDKDLCMRNLWITDLARQHDRSVTIEPGQYLCKVTIKICKQAWLANHSVKKVRCYINHANCCIKKSQLLLQRPQRIGSNLLLFHMLAKHLSRVRNSW